MDGVHLSRVREPLRGDSLLFTTKPRSSRYSFDQPLKDEKLSQPWSNSFEPGTLD